MKVAKVEVFPLFVPFSKPIDAPVSIPYAAKTQHIVFGGYRATIVRLTTDDGLVGVGECLTRLAPAAMKKIIEEIAPLVIGSNPLQPEATWEVLYATMMNRGHNRGFYIEAISGIDVALWDLRAKAYGQPLYMFLGGRQRDKVPSYASSLRMGEKSAVLETAHQFLDLGFKGMKIKIGKNPHSIHADLRLIEAIRKEVGDDIMLAVDANCSYHEDYKMALRIGRGLEGYGIRWFEEPISPDNIRGYKYLHDNLDIPIAWGESSFTRFDFANMFLEDCIDIVQPDVCRVGGLTEVARIAAMSQSFHTPYAPHTGSSSAVCLAVSLHIAAALPNLMSFELMRSDWSKKEHNPLRHDLVTTQFEFFEDGFLLVPSPDKPGIGIELNEEILRRYTIS
jgi:D-galactarolactone cycloisomerase